METIKERIIKICPNFDFNILSEKELHHLTDDNDLIKGFNCHKQNYITLKKEINPFDEIIFFDLCYLLGLFSKDGEDIDYISNVIKYLFLYYTPMEIASLITKLDKIVYNEKFAITLINAILDDTLKDNISLFADFYNNFSKFKRNIYNINKNRLKIINMRHHKQPEDHLLIEQIRQKGKAILNDDVQDYIQKIKILEANPQLKKLSNILLLETYDQRELKEIIQFYKYSTTLRQNDELYLQNIQVTTTQNETVEWLSQTDPWNLVLGYLLNVCSTFTGSGSKIMIDSILDPKNKNIVIKNRAKNIIAKATALYTGQYLFCNVLNFIPKLQDKLTKDQELDYYYYYLKTICLQYQAMINRHYQVDYIKIGESEQFIKDCLDRHPQHDELIPLLSKLVYGCLEFDEELFNHKEPQYYIKNKKYRL